LVKSSEELAINIAKVLDDKKGKDILVLDVREITLVADYFVIVTGTSSLHVQSLAEHVMDTMREEHCIKPLNKEGLTEGNWVLVDYDSVVLHIFQGETRAFYNLERLWGEAREVEMS